MYMLRAASASSSAVATMTLPIVDTFIYFVRHGETTANRDRIRQGHLDYPLTERGVQGALAVGEALKDVPFDAIFSSDLGRGVSVYLIDSITYLSKAFLLFTSHFIAYKTCELLMSKLKHVSPSISIQSEPLLREINFGIREGLNVDVSFDEARELLARQRGVSAEDIENEAESDDALFSRHDALLRSVRHRCTASRPHHVLCVTHGGFIRSLLRHRLPGKADFDQKIENCSITVVRAQWNSEASESINPSNRGDELEALPTLSLNASYYNIVDHLLNPASYSFIAPSL